MAEKKPPLRARLQRGDLTPIELTLLEAIVEHSWAKDGQNVYASPERLAAWAKCCDRTIRRLIHGYTRSGTFHPGLLERHILVRKNNAYYLNEAAIPEDPRVKKHLDKKRRRPAQQLELLQTDTVSATAGHGVRNAPDTVSAEPKASSEPKAFDPGAFTEALIEAIQRSPYPLVATKEIRRAIAGSFQALITGGESPPDAFEFLLAVTLDGIQRGKTINRFWFEDAKWRQADDTQQISRSAARVANQLRAAPDAVRGYRAATNGDHRRTYEN